MIRSFYPNRLNFIIFGVIKRLPNSTEYYDVTATDLEWCRPVASEFLFRSGNDNNDLLT